MSWTSGLPNASRSVRANRAPLQSNFTYIEQKMGKIAVGTNPVAGNTVTDHFWATDATLDGHHRFLKMPKFTSTNGALGTDANNPVLGTSIDGCIYLRNVNADVARVEGFYRNTQGVYQFIPSYVTVDLNSITTSMQTIATIPKNVYGEIFWYKIDPATSKFIGTVDSFGQGAFVSNETVVRGLGRDAINFGGSLLNLQAASFTVGVIPSTTPRITGKIRFKITYRAQDQDG